MHNQTLEQGDKLQVWWAQYLQSFVHGANNVVETNFIIEFQATKFKLHVQIWDLQQLKIPLLTLTHLCNYEIMETRFRSQSYHHHQPHCQLHHTTRVITTINPFKIISQIAEREREREREHSTNTYKISMVHRIVVFEHSITSSQNRKNLKCMTMENVEEEFLDMWHNARV